MNVLTVFLAAWRGAPPRGLTHAEERAGVRLLAAPVCAPETPIERFLVETLTANGPLPRPARVSLAAIALHREELSHSGWLADLGILDERLFVSGVSRAPEAGYGVLWEIEIPGCCRC